MISDEINTLPITHNNMQLTILQQDLLPALQAVSRSVGIRTTLPVLANVLIAAGKNQLSLSATNLEIGIVKSLKAQVSEVGSLTVPAKTLLDIVSSLGAVEITFIGSDDQLKISAKNFNANLNGISATEFPNIPLASDQAIKVNPKLLLQVLPQITFAAASDEGRPILTGILTQIKKNTLELVATDGFRLAHKTIPIEEAADLSVLIPRRTFEEILHIISEEKVDESLEIATSENQNQIVFKLGNTQLSSRLIEGNYPAWEKIIPVKFENKTIINRLELLKAVKLASVFARDSANIVKIQTEDSQVKLTSEAKELGGQETDLSAQITGEKITIAYNSRFLIDSLTACPSDEISIEFSGNLSPTLIKPVAQAGLEYVVMPVRLS